MKDKIKFFLLIPATVFFAGCSLVSGTSDGGMVRSDDGGKSFLQKVTIDEETKIGSVDVLSMAVNPQNGNEVFIGTKANGVFKTSDAGEKWQSLKVAETTVTKVYSLAIDPINPGVVYAAGIVGGRGKIMKSTDGGATWKDTYSEPSSGSLILALAVDPTGSGKIFGGTTKGQIILSENNGETWQNLHKAKGEVFKIAIDHLNSNRVYFAVNQTGLVRTRDGGKSFEDLGARDFLSGQQQLGNPTAILTDSIRENWIYAGTTEGLFRSKNGGDDWELMKVLNSPQEISIRGIAVNPLNSDEIIYGAAQAFYKSVDGGQSWATTQFAGSRTIEIVAYNPQNPGVIYVGMNKR